MADETDPPTGRAPRARTAPGVAPKNRDDLSDEARADRARSIPEYTGEDITGEVMAMTDDELAALADGDNDLTPEERADYRKRKLHADREARPTMQRVRHVERKLDEIVPTLAHIRGVLEVLPAHVQDAATAAREAAAAANALASAHQRATLTATLETDGAATVGAIQVRTAEKLEASDKRKTWREIGLLVLKIVVAALMSAAGVGEVARLLGGG